MKLLKLYFFRRAEGEITLIYNSRKSVFSRGQDKLTIILSGGINVNFALENSGPIIKFLQEHLNLTMNNEPIVSTAAPLILYSLEIFISYFSYHKPIKTFVPIQSPPTEAMVVNVIPNE